MTTLTNEKVAGCLEEIAELLESHGANAFRVRAYRTGAQTIRALRQPVRELLEQEGRAGLERLAGIGRSLASAIEQLDQTGRLPLLERLRGDSTAERAFATVPDIGPGLAERIHEHLGIETLAELETAASDGRLAQVPGMGPKRIRAVRESLAGRFRRPPPPIAPAPQPQVEQPPIEELLDVDREYRHLDEMHRLPRIAPRRFNPTGAAWLPVLHTSRDDRHYTALYSNTARAHELGTTHDWVVIYRDDHQGHGQWTVITGQFGKLRGRRMVRGRESECQDYYQSQSEAAECGSP